MKCYDASSPFANGGDVVHAIVFAVGTLEGNDTGLSKAEALKVLVHLVGDIHQPLHTVTGYSDITNPQAPRLLSPSEATIGSQEDAGGNGLFYTKSHELHALWDTGLLVRVSKEKDYRALASVCEKINAGVTGQCSGDHHGWPASWASESITAGTDPSSIAGRTLGNPVFTALEPRTRAWRAAEIPAAGGIGNARSVAEVQSILANGGVAKGRRILSETGARRALEPQIAGTDLVLGLPVKYGMGYGLAGDMLPLPNPNTCFWGGWGGSLVVIDMDARACFSYVMNKMGDGTTGDMRAFQLIMPIYQALAAA